LIVIVGGTSVLILMIACVCALLTFPVRSLNVNLGTVMTPAVVLLAAGVKSAV